MRPGPLTRQHVRACEITTQDRFDVFVLKARYRRLPRSGHRARRRFSAYRLPVDQALTAMSLDKRLAGLRDQIPELTPHQACALMGAGELLIDVRDPGEWAQGMPQGARGLSLSELEFRIVELASPEAPIMLICASGRRSLLAADDLQKLGYERVRIVTGGTERWKREGLPWVRSELIDDDGAERYARQMNLPEIGIEGQAKLSDARVLLVGAGGLGSPAALYLAAAGVGTLGLVDDDRVERSNLHRQVLHCDDRIGWSKTDSARITLEGLNPKIDIRTHELRLDPSNIEDVFSDYRIIVDGSDNFPTRYLVNDTCIRLGLPNVYGAVQRFEGRVSVFPAGGRPCYRCLFSEPPAPETAPSCNEAGVLGVVPGVIGSLQALEAIKLATGIGEPLIGRLLLFDARKSRMREVVLAPDPGCRYCADRSPVANEAEHCGVDNYPD